VLHFWKVFFLKFFLDLSLLSSTSVSLTTGANAGQVLSPSGKNYRLKNDIRTIEIYGNQKRRHCNYRTIPPTFTDIPNAGKYFNPIHPRFFELADIPENKTTYPIQTWGPNIQEFLNETNPGTRLLCFSEHSAKLGIYQPIFAGDIEHYDKVLPIFLYSKNGVEHYCAVRCMNSLFKKNGCYCIHCLATYDNKHNHSVTCKGKCKACNRIGKGPCKRDKNFLNQICPDCNRIFKSQECFDYHKQKEKWSKKYIDENGNQQTHRGETSLCERAKGCKECGVTYFPKVLARNGQKGLKIFLLL